MDRLWCFLVPSRSLSWVILSEGKRLYVWEVLRRVRGLFSLSLLWSTFQHLRLVSSCLMNGIMLQRNDKTFLLQARKGLLNGRVTYIGWIIRYSFSRAVAEVCLWQCDSGSLSAPWWDGCVVLMCHCRARQRLCLHTEPGRTDIIDLNESKNQVWL